MPGDSGELAVTTVCTLPMHTGCGRIGRPAFPTPSIGEGRFESIPRAFRAAGMQTRIYNSLSSSANGSAEWPLDDRLRRTIQYPRDVSDRAEKPRRTGYPACAGYDSWARSGVGAPAEWRKSLLVRQKVNRAGV